MSAPVSPYVVVHVHGSCADPALGGTVVSLPKEFPHEAHDAVLGRGDVPGARRADPYAYRRVFPDRWAAFLRSNFRNSVEVAAFFDVTHRTAENWMNGTGRATGDKVALAALSFPQAFIEGVAA